MMKTWEKLRLRPHLWQKYFVREKIIHAIRQFFRKEKYHEVETPLLLPAVIPESYLEVFTTYFLDHKRKKRRMFLPTSPEVALKKLLVAGIGNCFAICKNFRNTESESKTHLPEFTILEWYRLNITYQTLMSDCERLILYISDSLTKQKVNHLHTIDLSRPWERISVAQALEKYANVDFYSLVDKKALFTPDKIAHVAKKKGYQVTEANSWEEIFNQIFLNEIEPQLTKKKKPIIIYDYPKPVAALSKLHADEPYFAQRFEIYIGGIELIDGCTELTDWKEQLIRYKNELELRHLKNKLEIVPDMDFIEALKAGLPDCSGAAMGIDRLVMLFSQVANIAQTLYFPL